MGYIQAKCPNCGAFISVTEGVKADICPYCKKAYVAEEAIALMTTQVGGKEEKAGEKEYVSKYLVGLKEEYLKLRYQRIEGTIPEIMEVSEYLSLIHYEIAEEYYYRALVEYEKCKSNGYITRSNWNAYMQKAIDQCEDPKKAKQWKEEFRHLTEESQKEIAAIEARKKAMFDEIMRNPLVLEGKKVYLPGINGYYLHGYFFVYDGNLIYCCVSPSRFSKQYIADEEYTVGFSPHCVKIREASGRKSFCINGHDDFMSFYHFHSEDGGYTYTIDGRGLNKKDPDLGYRMEVREEDFAILENGYFVWKNETQDRYGIYAIKGIIMDKGIPNEMKFYKMSYNSFDPRLKKYYEYGSCISSSINYINLTPKSDSEGDPEDLRNWRFMKGCYAFVYDNRCPHCNEPIKFTVSGLVKKTVTADCPNKCGCLEIRGSKKVEVHVKKQFMKPDYFWYCNNGL